MAYMVTVRLGEYKRPHTGDVSNKFLDCLDLQTYSGNYLVRIQMV